jgi:hypothetical protein
MKPRTHCPRCSQEWNGHCISCHMGYSCAREYEGEVVVLKVNDTNLVWYMGWPDQADYALLGAVRLSFIPSFTISLEEIEKYLVLL